jgi:hypothetical protein
MDSIKTKKFIKLGTTLRYLIDVKEGDPLGDKHILQSIDTVITLVEQLGFKSTLQSAGLSQLKDIGVLLRASSTSETSISKSQADELERIGRKIRESLLIEGDGIEVVKLSEINDKQSLDSPEKVTLKWLFTHVPVPLWMAFFGLLGGAYLTGVKTSQHKFVIEIFGLKSQSEISTQNSQGLKPNSENIQNQPEQKRIQPQPKKVTYKLLRSDVNRPSGQTHYIACGDPDTWIAGTCKSDINKTYQVLDDEGVCGQVLYTVTCVPK